MLHTIASHRLKPQREAFTITNDGQKKQRLRAQCFKAKRTGNGWHAPLTINSTLCVDWNVSSAGGGGGGGGGGRERETISVDPVTGFWLW